jgi:hypothetical protein
VAAGTSSVPWGEIIPKFLLKFPPKSPVLLDVSAAAAPLLRSSAAGGLQGTAGFRANITVEAGGGAPEYACTLAIAAQFGVQLDVRQNASATLLLGNVTSLTLNATVEDSNIGPLNPVPLALLSEVFAPLITQALDALLQKGFPLPSAPFFSFANTTVQFQDGFFEVASDFTSNVTAL